MEPERWRKIEELFQAMLDHANIGWTIESLRLALSYDTEGFRLVSYLPMAHIAERVVTHYSCLTLGYAVTTCPDLHFLATYLRETEPELLFGVTRTLSTMWVWPSRPR